MYTSNPLWHELLWQQVQRLEHEHLDLLIDATSLNYPLLQELASLVDGPELAKLFDHTPEAAIADAGPLLLRLQARHQPWLKAFFSAVDCTQHVLALLSPWRFDALAAHLSRCTQAQWNQGREQGVLRYYDPRLFLPVSEALTPAQGRVLHGPVIAWHWLDRDHRAQHLLGRYSRHNDAPTAEGFIFDSAQIASLRAWADADGHRREHSATPQHYGLSREEGLMRHLFHSQMAACQQGLQEPHERQAFIRQWLLDNSPFVVDE